MSKQHAAYSRISESDTIVVFVHGIQGSPRQFNYIASNVPKHIDYMCVLLPGHGKTILTPTTPSPSRSGASSTT